MKVGEGSWRDDYVPLIGILSAAQESVTESQLETFANRPDVWSLLGDLGQFTDTIPLGSYLLSLNMTGQLMIGQHSRPSAQHARARVVPFRSPNRRPARGSG